MAHRVLFTIFILSLSFIFFCPAAADEHGDHIQKGKAFFLEYFHKENLALEEFRKAAELKPDDAETLLWLGMALYHNGEFDEALETLKKADGLKKDDFRIHAYLAYTYGRLKKKSALKEPYYKAMSIKEISRALKLNPKCSDCHVAWGIGFDHLGLMEKAEESFARAIEANPDYYWPYALQGNVYLKTKRAAKAKELFDKATGMAREQTRNGKMNDELLRGIAMFYEAAGMWDKALETADMALSWNPEDKQLLPRFSIKKLIERIKEEKHTGKTVPYDMADELIVGGIN